MPATMPCNSTINTPRPPLPHTRLHSQRYQMLNEADARENAEAVTAIDDFLERSQDVVGAGGTSTPTSGDVVNGATGAANAEGSGHGEGERARNDEAGLKRRTGWMGSSRWSRSRQP